MSEPQTIKSLTKELREAKAEIFEDGQIKNRLIAEKKDLETKNERLQTIRVEMYHSLKQEHFELVGRVLRVEQRMRALGFEPPKEKP